ncbi:hypothetical protein HMPREF9154_0929 [Arachnia propionica F0230a]|nr:hypothetical protein HMPREF9154_0929 [Arachnia propionica F0230a]
MFVPAAVLAAEVAPALEPVVVPAEVVEAFVAGAVLLTEAGSSAFTSLAFTHPTRVPAASRTAAVSPANLAVIFLNPIAVPPFGFVPWEESLGSQRWVSPEKPVRFL